MSDKDSKGESLKLKTKYTPCSRCDGTGHEITPKEEWISVKNLTNVIYEIQFIGATEGETKRFKHLILSLLDKLLPSPPKDQTEKGGS